VVVVMKVMIVGAVMTMADGGRTAHDGRVSDEST